MIFDPYLEKLNHEEASVRMKDLLSWVHETFPKLKPELKWNQPMFTEHGTFIIGFSVSQKHMAVAIEQAGLHHFSEAIRKAGYEQTKEIFRIRWDQPVDHALLKEMIEFNMKDKAYCRTFWRPTESSQKE